MKPGDLRRDAYTWDAIANSADARAEECLRNGLDHIRCIAIGNRFEDAAASIREAIEGMNALADELEARDAS